MKSSTSKFQKFLKKLKKTVFKGIDWASDHKRITVPAGAGVLVIIVVVIAVTANLNKKTAQETDAEVNMATVSQDGTVKEESLEENAYPEVNNLINKYYQALADGDMDVVEQCRNYTENTEKIRLEKKSQYIDSYQNIIVYTKKGMLENTYLAYVYYEVKFKDIETSAPALNSLYICPNEAGELYIYEGEIDDNVSSFIKEMSTQDNVVELFNRVDVKCSEAIASDEALSKFLDELPTKIKTEVGEALAAGEASTESVSSNTVSENNVEETPAEVPAVQPAAVEMVQTTDTVNVRSSDSETADKVGKALSGEQFKRLETKENGWSKIEFEGKEAYVKSEFLTVVGTAEQTVVTPPAETQKTEETPKEEAPVSTPSPEGKVTAKETVNVRKSANESSEKLGVAYQGDQFELIMKQADGWSKIKYKGKTGYVKNDYVE